MEKLTMNKLTALRDTFDPIIEEAAKKAELRYIRMKGKKDFDAPTVYHIEEVNEDSILFHTENRYGYSEGFLLTFDQLLMDEEAYLTTVDAEIQRKKEQDAEWEAKKKAKNEAADLKKLAELEAKYRTPNNEAK